MRRASILALAAALLGLGACDGAGAPTEPAERDPAVELPQPPRAPGPLPFARFAAPAVASTIVFDSDRLGNRDLWAMRPDGSGLRRLTDHPGVDALASLSPDGHRIAFLSNRDNRFALRVYVMRTDETDVRRLTAGTAFETSPAWSPDGGRIAFDRTTGPGQLDVFVIDADGTGEVRLTDSPGIDRQAAWSPDGRRIAFASDRDGPHNIYVMMADGSAVTPLTAESGAHDEAPAWSPDGRRIAFHSTRDGGLGVYVMAADGSDLRRIADDGFRDASPTWSPDSQWIAFHRRTGLRDPPDIYIVPADGSGPALRLTDHVGLDGWPEWGRRLR